jgi:hypothetical protein
LAPGAVDTPGCASYSYNSACYIDPLLLPFSSDRGAVEQDKTGALREITEKMTVQSVEVASAKLIDIIDNSTREKEGGEFVTFDGERIPW